MTFSKSEKYMSNKSHLPDATETIRRSVSQFRREQITQDVENGLFRQGSYVTRKEGLTSSGIVLGGISKKAQIAASSGGYSGSQGDSFRQATEIYSPLWLTSNLSLPRDRVTVNAWARAFYALNPIVRNAISLHSTYPISKLNIKCANKDIERFFAEMIEEIDLMNVCIEMAHEYWLLGEVFPYLELDESTGKWSRIIIQNPDYMIVQKSPSSNHPIIMMKPDDRLKKLVSSNKPSDIEERRQLNPYIVDAVRKGGNIVMNSFNASYLANKTSSYEVRGSGLPLSIFRNLMLFDMLRESKYVQASSMVNPTTVVKIGSADFKPTLADLEAYRATFEQAEGDKNFKIFTHDGVTIDRIGFGSGIYDIGNDITQLLKEMYIGLMVPSVVMDGSSDISYANGGVALDVLRQRYMTFRNIMSNWLKTKVFAPIAQIHEFYEYDGDVKKLIIPEVDWNHMNLFDATDYISTLKELATPGQDGSKRVSSHTLYRSLGLDYQDEVIKMRKELVQEAILKKEKASLETMTLNELRSLNDDDEIPEAKDEIVPGESPEGDAGGMGLPGGPTDLGAPPPMPAPGLPE